MRSIWAPAALAAAVAGSGAVAADAGAADRETIVVTGTARPVEASRLGRSLTVLDGAAIEAQGVQFLSDALRAVPGLAVSRQGGFGGLTAVRVRGAEANHVLVLVDGVEISSADTGEVDLAALLALDVEHVEVLRGPQSGLYGSNALAGVINVITRRGGDGAWASVEGGSFETIVARAGGGLGGEDGYLSGAVGARSSGGFNISPNGDEKDGDSNTSVLLRGGAAIGPELRVDGLARVVTRETDTDDFDFSGGPNQGLSLDAPGFSDATDWSLAGSAELALLDGRLISRLSAARTETELEGGGSFGVFGSETARTKLSASFSLAFETFGGRAAHASTLFAEHERESFRNTEPFDPSQIPTQERELTGVGFEHRVALFDRLDLSAVVRRDANGDFDDATTFSAAAAWRASEATLIRASVGTGVTNPTFFEQFGFDPGTFVGNPDLTPERATGWDAGVEHAFAGGAVVLDVTYFQSALEDEIVNAFPSVVNETGESKRRGIEVSLNARLGEAWDLAAAYTRLDAEDSDGSAEVRRPEHAASLDLTRRFGRGHASLGVVHNGRMLDDDFRGGFSAVKSPLAAYTLTRIAGAVRFVDGVELFARVENGLDEDYQEVIGYETPGRAAYVGVRLTSAAVR